MSAKNTDTTTDDQDKGPIELINENGALFWYARNWYPKPDVLYNALLIEIEWEQRTGFAYEKEYTVPRLMYHMGDDEINTYPMYGGDEYIRANPWHYELKKLRDILEKCFNCYLDTCLLNYYRDGKDTIAMHPDRESKGSKNITIGISLGESRTLVFKRNSDDKTISFENRSGDLYIMQGTIHKLWKHGIPRCKDHKGGRISLTFRQIMPNDYHIKKRKM